MVWELKRTVSMRRFFYKFWLRNKKIKFRYALLTKVLLILTNFSILDLNPFLTNITNVKQKTNTDGDVMIKSMMLAYDYNYSHQNIQ